MPRLDPASISKATVRDSNHFYRWEHPVHPRSATHSAVSHRDMISTAQLVRPIKANMSEKNLGQELRLAEIKIIPPLRRPIAARNGMEFAIKQPIVKMNT